jgi:hypothetical protein
LGSLAKFARFVAALPYGSAYYYLLLSVKILTLSNFCPLCVAALPYGSAYCMFVFPFFSVFRPSFSTFSTILLPSCTAFSALSEWHLPLH